MGPMITWLKSQRKTLEYVGAPTVSLNSEWKYGREDGGTYPVIQLQILISKSEDTEWEIWSRSEVFRKNEVLRSDYIKENAIVEITDEGHCISKWDSEEEDFRPDCGKLSILRAHLPLPNVCCIGHYVP